MIERIFFIILIFIIFAAGISLMIHLYNRKVAEEKIDQYIADYGIPKKEIKSVHFPMFNSPFAPIGFSKTVFVKNEKNKQNYYIFHYDPSSKKIIFTAVVEGNEVGIHDKLIKKLKYQPSEKVLHE
ncbi:hypothetical protein JOD45_002162 [Scopulibacillus daqui]|uniref:DUF3139 domain-containing protein n=1 Tax=Scopulibacillus daqui TaxID=1469162 RepID=A0ABS2Q333_9BACL|nr:hypothetical protein [Scopulibacillus daqui]MBM7645937.1 hypothetical protein [Scopulibacillus daqui]